MTKIVQDLIEKDYDHEAIEEDCWEVWEGEKLYDYAPNNSKELFSIDTPPPYVSAAHLHVGHAMSYAQAEFVVRYKRMRGFNVFYPMGFDDNGLPTERFVEQTYNVNKSNITREKFRELCMEETAKGAKTYEEMWRNLGLSVDWSLRYSTIDPHCQRTSQKSFIDLYNKGLLYRDDSPVIWDTHFETSLAQADVDTLTRNGQMHDIAFKSVETGENLVISTTRPELIPACVAMYFHPKDERYQHLEGKEAEVPLFGHKVPIRTSEEVDMEFGTGLMQVCTFGDGEDVKKWKDDKLDTRICINPNGTMTGLAGPFAGMKVEQARKEIVKALKENELILISKQVKQNVSVSERSNQPIEFVMAPQWFIRLLDYKDEFLKRSEQLQWYPDYMKVRLDDWINGLKYDWNISRQRFYGVPFPIWYCKDCGTVVVADEASLPVDPAEQPCPVESCSNCGSTEFEGESDVMETWMTSSLTPLVNANWAGTEGRKGDMSIYPMTLRVQAFEIIRTWLFYTVAKSHFHHGGLPWRDCMISGWGLNEQGKKISKRDLEKFTDEEGYNRYDPHSVIKKYSADALRFWAAGSHLGNDLRFNEKDVRTGRKVVIKLWNVARLCNILLEGFDPSAPRPDLADRSVEDRWVQIELTKTIKTVTDGFERYDYAYGREALERFFWGVFCDNYVEIVKDRFWNPARYSEELRASAQATMWESLRTLLALFAPYLPFITEAIFQRLYKPYEDIASIHIADWPEEEAELKAAETPVGMALILDLLNAARELRSKNKISQTKVLEGIRIDMDGADDGTKQMVQELVGSIQSATRCKEVVYGPAEYATAVDGVKLEIVAEA